MDKVAGAERWRFSVDLVSALRDVAARFPVPLLATLLLCGYLNWQLHADWPGIPGLRDVAAALCSALFLSLAATVFAQSRRLAPVVGHAAALAAALLAFAVIAFGKRISTFSEVVLIVSMGCLVVAPFATRRGDAQLWSYGRRLVVELIFAGLLLIAISSGVSSVIFAVEYLFDVEAPLRANEHVWWTATSFFAPLFVLARFPRRFDERPDDALANTIAFTALRGLADFVAAPVLLALAAIIHVYALKVLIDWDLPKGRVGWFAVSYGVSLVALLLAVDPFRSVARSPLRIVLRFWPLSLPVPIVLLAVALAERIGQYGVTPERYLLFVLGIVLAGLFAIHLFPRIRGDLRLYVAVPLLVLLPAIAGPWGAIEVSVASQSKEFETLVAEPDRSRAQVIRARELLRFLAIYDALDRVAPDEIVVGELKTYRDRELAIRRISSALGFETWRSADGEAGFRRQRLHFSSIALESRGFDLMVSSITIGVGRPAGAGLQIIILPDSRVLTVTQEREALIVAVADISQRFDLPADALKNLVDRGRNADAIIDLEAGGREVRLVVADVVGGSAPDDPISNITYSLLLRRDDWN